MRAMRILLVILGLSLALACRAEDMAGATRAPGADRDQSGRFFTMVVENDAFAGGTDEHYTSGLRLTWLQEQHGKSSIGHRVMDALPGEAGGAPLWRYFSFGQNIYTPEDIEAPRPDPNDQPYAAFLYGAVGFTRPQEDHIDDVELTVGIVGPWALGEPTQKLVHRVTRSDEPRGWDHQLDNEPGLMASWQRRWRGPSFPVGSRGEARLVPHLGLTVGNVYTYSAAGLTFHVAPTGFGWESAPLRVRPAVSDTAHFYPIGRGPDWSLFAGVEARAVARDIFLDGNTFSDSPSVDRKPFVIDASVGGSIVLGRTRVAYTVNWRSKDFEGEDSGQLFGALSLGWRY